MVSFLCRSRFIEHQVEPIASPQAAMPQEGVNDKTWVGAHAVFEAPETPTMSRGNGADAGEPVAESQYPAGGYPQQPPGYPQQPPGYPQQPPGYPVAAVADRASAPGAGGVEPSVIWEGTTWDSCPTLCMCCAPVRSFSYQMSLYHAFQTGVECSL